MVEELLDALKDLVSGLLLQSGINQRWRERITVTDPVGAGTAIIRKVFGALL